MKRAAAIRRTGEGVAAAAPLEDRLADERLEPARRLEDGLVYPDQLEGMGGPEAVAEAAQAAPIDEPERRMTRTKLVARNVSATLVTQIVSWILTFTVTIYVPRYLKDTGFGVLTFAGTFAGIFGMFVDLGTSTVLLKEIAKDHNRIGEIVSNALAFRLPLAIAAFVIGVLAAHFLRYPLYIQEMVAIGLGLMIPTQVSGVVSSALAGMEKLHSLNAVSIVEKVLGALLMIALVIHRAPLWQFMAIGAITAPISIGLSLYYFRPYIRLLRRPSLIGIRQLAVAGVPYITSTIFNAIYIKTDMLVMSKISTFAAIGWYGLGSRLAGTFMTIPVMLTGATFPTATRVYHEDRSAFELAIRRTFNLVLICVVPFSALLLMVPDKLISLMHYPPVYRHSIPVLMVWGCALILYFLSQVAAMALNACDRQWTLSRVCGIAALFSVPLTVFCIYVAQKYLANGALGAIVSDVLAEVYIVIAYTRALPPGIFQWSNLGVLLRCLVAALPTIAVLHFFVHSLHDLAWAVPAALAYLPLCWAMGCLHPRDIEMARQLLKR